LQKTKKPGGHASPDAEPSETPMTSATPAKAQETDNKKKKRGERDRLGDGERD
jgi:hypothetical protein